LEGGGEEGGGNDFESEGRKRSVQICVRNLKSIRGEWKRKVV